MPFHFRWFSHYCIFRFFISLLHAAASSSDYFSISDCWLSLFILMIYWYFLSILPLRYFFHFLIIFWYFHYIIAAIIYLRFSLFDYLMPFTLIIYLLLLRHFFTPAYFSCHADISFCRHAPLHYHAIIFAVIISLSFHSLMLIIFTYYHY